MAAYCRVYDSRHLPADCQQLGSAPESYAHAHIINHESISEAYRYACMETVLAIPHTQTHTRLTALCPGLPG